MGTFKRDMGKGEGKGAMQFQIQQGGEGPGGAAIGVGGCCGLLPWFILNLLYCIFGGQHINNKSCDPLNDGVGIAQWMLISGIFGFITMCCLCAGGYAVKGGAMASAAEGGAAAGGATTISGLCLCCIGLFVLAWNIYGMVVIFKDHPDVSGCPGEVHMVGYVMMIITFVMMGLSCICGCVGLVCMGGAATVIGMSKQ